jgi:hypothetical protein
MINPDKHIRTAFYERLTAAGIKVYDSAIPKSVEAGDTYIVISNQTQLDDYLGRGCTHLDCTIVLDLTVLQDVSYISSSEMDDFYQQVMNLIDHTLEIAHFQLHSIQRDGTPRNLPVTTDTLSILRKIVTYRLRLKPLPVVEPQI